MNDGADLGRLIASPGFSLLVEAGFIYYYWLSSASNFVVHAREYFFKETYLVVGRNPLLINIVTFIVFIIIFEILCRFSAPINWVLCLFALYFWATYWYPPGGLNDNNLWEPLLAIGIGSMLIILAHLHMHGLRAQRRAGRPNYQS